MMTALASNDIDAEVVYSGPIEAPIAKGDQIAELVFTLEGLPETRIPLVADRDVASGGFVSRVTTAAMLLFTRLVQGSEAQS